MRPFIEINEEQFYLFCDKEMKKLRSPHRVHAEEVRDVTEEPQTQNVRFQLGLLYIIFHRLYHHFIITFYLLLF